MLRLLEIKNIALIDGLQLELSNGLNILSGETGAGKSIIIDSFNFVMGERADKSLIRHGQEFASVQAVFESYLTPNVQKVLDEYGISVEDELVLYRKMSVLGKNECRINGRLVNLSVLKELTSNLADIHGQHEHQSLLNPENHLVLLDKFAGNTLNELKSEYISVFDEYNSIKSAISKFTSGEDRLRRLDILNYQISEIEAADLHADEEEEIKAKLKRLSNQEKIAENLNMAVNSLVNDDFSADNSMNAGINSLYQISEYDKEIAELAERLSGCEIELKDIAESLEGMLENTEYNVNEVEELQDRYDLIKNLERKYGKNITEVYSYLDKCKEEQEFLINSEQELLKLEKDLEQKHSKALDLADELSRLRKKIGEKLTSEIQTQLAELGMKNAKFGVKFEEKGLSSDGIDVVEFMFSANLGEPLKPLAKVISGGEMSRFMLAMKVILADIDSILTMVFDEIDTGVSGAIAQTVAVKLFRISKNRQVIAVTHLPQLTSMADKHYLIEKSSMESKTNTNVYLLDYNGSVKEIARLIGSVENSSYGELHAKEMKAYADNLKKTI